LPGDDLLSELLDESLVAHAEAPRPPGNPYAVNLGFVRSEQAENNSPSETEGSSEEVESPGNNIVSSETVPESILESTSNSVPEFLSETHSETLSESIAKVVPEAVAEAVSEPNASTLPAMIDEKEKEKEKEEEEKAPSNDKRSSASLDATASAPRPASPNISGGPPPRRRRT